MSVQNKSNVLEVSIMGHKVSLRSNDKDPEMIQEIAELVSERIKKAEERIHLKNAVPHQVAVLALLDLAEEFIDSKKRIKEYRTKMSEKSSRLIQLLEAEYRAPKTKSTNLKEDSAPQMQPLPHSPLSDLPQL